MNLKGLEAVSIQYLNAHPEEFYAFSRILTQADDALGKHGRMTRGAVMRWIRHRIKQESYDETMPVYQFLKSVYLQGWEGSDFILVDEDDREYLYDLIGAVMGGMHLCTTCSTAHPMVRKVGALISAGVSVGDRLPVAKPLLDLLDLDGVPDQGLNAVPVEPPSGQLPE
jgi:hypothetical protein